jgi:hypothetical protein
LTLPPLPAAVALRIAQAAHAPITQHSVGAVAVAVAAPAVAAAAPQHVPAKRSGSSADSASKKLCTA